MQFTTISVRALALLAIASAVWAEPPEKSVIDVQANDPAKGWRMNIYGRNAEGRKGGGRVEVVPGRTGGKALRFVAEKAGAHNFISPDIPDGPWQDSAYTGVAIWYRGNGTRAPVRLVVMTQSREKVKGDYLRYAYSQAIDLSSREWRRVVLRRFRGGKGRPELDLSRVKRVYFHGQGTYDVTVGHVGLVSSGRPIFLEKGNLPQAVISELPSAPVIDGDLDDAPWRQATVISDFRVFAPAVRAAKYTTQALVGYRGNMLYLGVRMKGEKPGKILAGPRTFDSSVWRDSCFEFYLDPNDTDRERYQFCVNAVGSRSDYSGHGPWNGKWEARTQTDAKDGWTLEIACDLSSVGPVPRPGSVWGFNLKRHVPSPKRGFLEVSGWSQGTPAPASGFGSLVFGPLASANVAIDQVGLTALAPDSYALTTVIRNRDRNPIRLRVQATISSTGRSAEQHHFTAEIRLPAASQQALDLPMAFPLKRDGRYALSVSVRDTSGLLVHRAGYDCYLSPPVTYRESDVVLWPPPQVWKPAQGYWTLPVDPTLSISGAGDRFPADHLSDKLRKRYDTRVRQVPGANSDIALAYDAKGLKPEGFHLAVTPKGVRLRARDSRGMYYGVRAILDILTLSGPSDEEPRAVCVECVDWPAVSRRVLFHRMDHSYRIPYGLRTYKEFIYDQVAGGRFNLLILNLRGGVQYDTHPELSLGRALAKGEVRELLDFARKHYVDVAPGGNAPGHASWLTRRHPELREDGERGVLCTRHPDALPLVRDVYAELIDLFQPTEYFHLGGDEVRWKTPDVSPGKRCKRCAGVEKRDLLLEYWKTMAALCRERRVRPIIWSDMLAKNWNGRAPYHTARLVPRVPKDMIVATWSTRPITNPASVYREQGLTPWKINTAFPAWKMETLPGWWRDYDALGLGLFMAWPWSNFLHFDYKRVVLYSTPALHCCAACSWKPVSAAIEWHRFIAANGRHWIRVLHGTDWGARKVAYAPLSIASACNDTTRDAAKGDGTGWMDLGPELDLRSLPKPDLTIGGVPFKRPQEGADCVVLRGAGQSKPIPWGKSARGLVFLHAAGAAPEDLPKLHSRFLRRNMTHDGMPVAYYRIRYADGNVVSAPAQLGWNVHLWNCYPPARVMPGARGYWTGLTEQRRRKSPNAPDACAWTMVWKNPYPSVAVRDITFVAAGAEATVALLGITAVR